MLDKAEAVEDFTSSAPDPVNRGGDHTISTSLQLIALIIVQINCVMTNRHENDAPCFSSSPTINDGIEKSATSVDDLWICIPLDGGVINEKGRWQILKEEGTFNEGKEQVRDDDFGRGGDYYDDLVLRRRRTLVLLIPEQKL